MLTWIRAKFGRVVISIIVGFIAFVFVFFGVFSPRSTRGLHEGAVAGKVNGEFITIADFNREYSRRIEYFRKIMGDKMNEDQLKAFRLKGVVFQELVRKKLIVQQSHRMGLTASDEQIKESAREIPAFQKDGKFDFLTYKAVLLANQYTVSGFEKILREDLSSQLWERYFQGRTAVTPDEIRREFIITREKRKIKYIFLNPDTGKKDLVIPTEEIKKYLGDSNKFNLVRARFDGKKETEFKGKNLDDVKESIAKDLILGEKFEDIKKANDNIAEKILSMLSEKNKSDTKLVSYLKSYGLEVKTSGMSNRRELSIPGMGELKDLINDSFSKKYSLMESAGGTAKKYFSPSGILIAWLMERENADFLLLDEAAPELHRQLVTRRQNDLFQSWLKKVSSEAKIDPNPAVVNDDSG